MRADTNPASGGNPGGGAAETPGERRLVNWLLAAFIAIIFAAAFWLGDALLDARRADECIASGRRSCAPATVPAPPPR
jgi:hypothetical protein